MPIIYIGLSQICDQLLILSCIIKELKGHLVKACDVGRCGVADDDIRIGRRGKGKAIVYDLDLLNDRIMLHQCLARLECTLYHVAGDNAPAPLVANTSVGNLLNRLSNFDSLDSEARQEHAIKIE